ncbi:MAG: ABC transporter ATP-binding protein [Bacteroidales bacterium]|jgi:subfamily B ATP-binding cassette protein MsbA|nr:ABC transporter ATP-binding protein [Bacteroidales bacterium]
MKVISKLFSYIKPYSGKALSSILFSLLGTVFSLFSFTMAMPFLGILFKSQPMIGSTVPWEFSTKALLHNFNYFLSTIISTKGEKSALLTVSFLIISFALFKTAFYYLSRYVITPLRTGVVRDFRNNLNAKILDLQLAYFSEERKGDIISRMTADTQIIETTIIQSISNAIKAPITILIYLAMLFAMSPILTAFALVLIPLTGLIIGRIGSSLKRKSAKGQKHMGVILSYIEETLFGLKIIKAFNTENKIQKRFYDENALYTKIMNKIWRKKDLAGPLSEFLGTIVIVVVMWYGGKLVLSNDPILSPQAFMTYLIIFSQIIQPAKQLSTVYYNIQKGMASLDRIEDILNAETTITEIENPKSLTDFNNSISYNNVSFKYNTDYVLKNINLKIRKGKTIALVGQSGGGKSTLVDLLPRFYDITEGNIKIDDTEIKNLKINDLRKLMGIVNQESILFNDTIYNNIAFGLDEVSEKDVIEAAKVANAHEFISQTPNGYQTSIGDRGDKLSGGQKQRISIARAVLKNPPILILDEATSALDTESEKIVQEAIVKLMKNRTSIVIAHRLSTVRNADEICVIQKGEIVERGKHSELITQKGIYKKLNDLQMFA